MEDSPQLAATSSIESYMSPPHMLKVATLDPIHTALYVMFMLSVCALFSRPWMDVSGSGPRNVSKKIKDKQMVSLLSHQWLDDCVLTTYQYASCIRTSHLSECRALFIVLC
jgi:hypothetical protein